MKRPLQKILKSRLFENFSYLTVIQLVNILIPLVVYPYLIIRLGAELYGKVIYAASLNAYLIVLVNYGFDISAVKRVAENKENKSALFELFKNVLWSRIFLLLLSYVLFGIAMFTIPFVWENKILCLASTTVTLGELFFPRWYYLGMEQLKYTTLTVVIAKVISLILLFIFVTGESDILLVPLIMGLGTIVGSVFSMQQALKFLWNPKFGIKSLKPDFIKIRFLINEGVSFFLSRGFVVVREKAGILIIGELFGFREVSVFDLVQKIIKVLTITIDMINMVIFPRVAKTKDLTIVKKGAGVALLFTLLAYFIIIFFPFESIEHLKKIDLLQLTVELLYIFGFGLIMQVFVYFLGNTVLVVFGYNKEFNYTVIFGGIVYLACLSYGFISNISIMWIGYCTLISYGSIILTRAYFVTKYNLWK